MIKSPKISVIVPVYNAENYIEKCLLSIKHQTLKNIEIIVILIYSQRYAKYPSNTCITRLMGILYFHLLSTQKVSTQCKHLITDRQN